MRRTLNPSTPSLVVNCANQQEVDNHWEKLSSGGGRTSRCGWLKDKYGLSWQIVPTAAIELLTTGKDPAKSRRVMAALMGMTKIDLRVLQQAHAGAKAAN